MDRERGKVRWFNPDKAYGFIQREDGTDLFVHKNDIARADTLAKDQRVSFATRQTKKGLHNRPRAGRFAFQGEFPPCPRKAPGRGRAAGVTELPAAIAS